MNLSVPAPSASARAYPGLFISFEGGDGVGKTTQIELLSTLLAAARITYRRTREPGGTELGAQIRALLLHGGEVSPRAEALLYAADRAHHVTTVVRPALAAGAIVISDRYLDSSVAYQGAARELGPQEVRELSLWATGGLLPDLTILLDADADLARSRAGARGSRDRLEREPDAFHVALREEFRALAGAEPERIKVVDADQPVADVAAEVTGLVERLIAERGAGLHVEADSGRAEPVRPLGAFRTAVRSRDSRRQRGHGGGRESEQ
ncbi:dTMP kinase [Actinomyces sp. MRS3W]|uniref:dTMP kinase n=1 Tax=Actinomyces sp. MRS3W TaxID=2800796 RepID=UPI0028FDA7C6|nr:dTMP kinase [Actinomyces sp. MRS3W]MDU0347468.1 dTMP kinase [Actinomyces sp. MRS3W]